MFYGKFSDINDIKEEFQIDKELDGVEILYADYSLGSCDGQALVLFKENGKLFIVDASHCSCNGLEGCWSPDEVCEESIKKEVIAKALYRYTDFKSFVDFCCDYFKWYTNEISALER